LFVQGFKSILSIGKIFSKFETVFYYFGDIGMMKK